MRLLWAVGRWLTRVIELAVFFVWELALANLRVALDVVRPNQSMRPGIVAVPLSADSDLEIMFFANLITLTPGTLSLDVSDDRRILYVHAMYIDEVERVRARLKRTFEQRIMEVLP